MKSSYKAELIHSRVLVDSKVMLCKAWKTGLSNLNLERELAKLQKVREADSHMRLPARVPRFLGYVKHPAAGCVLRLLREWIVLSLSIHDSRNW